MLLREDTKLRGEKKGLVNSVSRSTRATTELTTACRSPSSASGSGASGSQAGHLNRGGEDETCKILARGRNLLKGLSYCEETVSACFRICAR